MKRLAVLLTCHNRRDQTLVCLRSLHADLQGAADFEVILTDDGSTDGTADAVLEEFPQVRVVEGDGSLYWSRGMELAWREALGGGFDAYLWVNDDVDFTPGGLSRLLGDAKRHRREAGQDAIVVGSVTDPDSGALTYGGSVLTSTWHPGRMRKVAPTDRSQPIDTFNGNVVLVPHGVVERIGIIDPVFSHAIGDNDYGLRARAAGIPVLLAPGTVGTCRRNAPSEAKLSNLFGRKGLPVRGWFTYTHRHGDWRWPIAFAGPYLRGLGSVMAKRSRRTRRSGPGDGLRVAHLLGPLGHSGAEMMLVSAAEIMDGEGVASAAVSLDDEAAGTATAHFRQAGFDVAHLGRSGLMPTLWAYQRFLRSWSPDCVHVHAERYSPFTTTIPRLLGIRVVRTTHSTFEFEGVLRARKRLERQAARAVGVRHVSISPTVAANEAERFANPTTTILNWFDERRFSLPTSDERARARLIFEVVDDRPVVAVVGNCAAVKNHRMLLDALAACPPSQRPLVIHAGAEGAAPGEREHAAEHGIAGDVIFMGATDQVVEVLHAADAFAMPSLHEGSSVAALEAAATGLPLVVADAPGLRDLSILGADAVTFHGHDVDELAAHLQVLSLLPVDDPRRIDTSGAVRALFCRRSGARAYIALYRGQPVEASADVPAPVGAT